MKQRICWAFVIPSREAENARVNILWLWSLDTINKGKNEYDSRSPSIFSNYISSYYFPYWKGILGFDVFVMVYRMLVLANYRLFSKNQVDVTNNVQLICTCTEALLTQYCWEGEWPVEDTTHHSNFILALIPFSVYSFDWTLSTIFPSNFCRFRFKDHLKM